MAGYGGLWAAGASATVCMWGFTIGSTLASIALSKTNTPAKIGSHGFQSAQVGLPIPILYGRCRIAGNLIYAGMAIPHEEGGGKGDMFGGGSGATSYNRDFLIGLCEGPATIIRCWVGSTITESFTSFPGDGANVGLLNMLKISMNRSLTQIVAPAREIVGDNKNLCCAMFSNAYIGYQPAVPQFSFEVERRSPDGEIDWYPTDIIKDLLTTPRYAGDFVDADLDLVSLENSKQYCVDNGIKISMLVDTQQPLPDWISALQAYYMGYSYLGSR